MDKATIMIVEDEGIVAKDIESSLALAGYAVTTVVASGEEAIINVSEAKPDLVLMDIILAGAMDGIEAARIIRTRFDIPIIYLTAYADDRTLQRAKLTEPYGYIIKPFEIKELQTTVAMALHRSRVDRRLRESEQWLFTILKDIGDAVIATDSSGRVRIANPMAQRLTGWSQEEGEGRLLAEIYQLVNECDGSPVDSALVQVLERGKTVGIAESVSLLSRAGRMIPLEGSISPIRDSKENVTGAVLVFRDIDERRKAECERATLEVQLRHAQKMEAIGELAGGIAHDFNNILTAIIGYSSMLQMRMKDDTLRSNVDHILGAAEKAASLTQGLLAFSRKQIMTLKPVSLNDVVRDVEKLLVRIIGENIKLKTILTQKQAMVLADSGHIEQVLMNFATNARDAMPEGGTIVIETDVVMQRENSLQTVDDINPGEYFLITVTDTGKGMDAATRTKIFQPFFTTKEQGKGTGLGLSIVYGIVRQHNGFINVCSAPDRGTSFRIYLPIASPVPDAPAIREREGQAELPGGRETILLAEDDEALRILLKDILELYGYSVIQAENGDDVLEKFKLHKAVIDLLLIDMVMPKKNGDEVSAVIREACPGTRVVFMSGYPPELLSRGDMLQEEAQFIQKPVSPRMLLRKVREVLDLTQPAAARDV